MSMCVSEYLVLDYLAEMNYSAIVRERDFSLKPPG